MMKNKPVKTELLFWNLILTTENPQRHSSQVQQSFISLWESIKLENVAVYNFLLFGDGRGNVEPLYMSKLCCS